MKKLRKNKLGISLVESIVYIAIVAILLTAVVTIHLTLGGTADKLGANVLASRNRRVAMGGIDYLIKNADGMLKDVNGDCSDFSADPPVLALYFEDDTYLPGTCVENGGGIKISVVDKQITMSCHPNMKGNGHYQNCDASVYPVVNSYPLSSPDVAVLNTSLDFSSSTATSTANSFKSLTTTLSVGTHSGGQIRLTATSTATSTVIMRNEQPDGLVARYEFNSGDDTTEAIDVVGNLTLACDNAGIPTSVSGLVDGSSAAYDFEYSENDYCSLASPDELAFGEEFSITAWINAESLTAEHRIVNNGSWTNQKGYQFFVDSDGDLICRVFDAACDACYTNTYSSAVISTGTTYHVSCVYDYNDDRFQVYTYQKAVGGVATSTSPGTIRSLVNNNETVNLGYSLNFDGIMDDVRLYNRALTEEEIWALQSQGAN